jgi:hypothetical protein
MKLKYIAVRIVKDGGYSPKKYTFKTYLEELAPHDLVMIQTVNGIYIGVEVEYVEKPAFECKWAFQRVNLEEIAFLDNLEREN